MSNYRSDLVPTTVLRRALFEYMEWAERVDPGAWSLLAEEHFGRIVEPDHLQSLDLLQTMHLIDLDASARDSAAMSVEARRRLFDEWFATAYTAYPNENQGETT